MKVWWIIYKMVGAPSFSQPFLCIQPLLQTPPKIHSSTSVNFHLPIPFLLFNKPTLTIPSNISPPYICAQPSQQSTPKIFSQPQPFSQFRLSQGTKELWSLVRNDTILISPFFFKVWTVMTGLTITNFLSLRRRKLVYCKY